MFGLSPAGIRKFRADLPSVAYYHHLRCSYRLQVTYYPYGDIHLHGYNIFYFMYESSAVSEHIGERQTSNISLKLVSHETPYSNSQTKPGTKQRPTLQTYFCIQGHPSPVVFLLHPLKHTYQLKIPSALHKSKTN